MSEPPEAIRRFQSSLEPYVKPREQVNYIRRILALHLGHSAHDAPVKQPLCLVDNWDEHPRPTEDVKGLHREYIDALNANASARRRFDNVLDHESNEPADAPQPASDGATLLEQRVGLLRLQKKRERLLAVQRHLDLLAQEPASSPGFTDLEQALQEARPLPEVPKEVVNSLVAEQSTPQTDLKGRANQLEKKVLRAKLLLKQEEKLLREAKARSQSGAGSAGSAGQAARLEALSVTRSELINWIETELSNASTEEAGGEAPEESHRDGDLEGDQATVTTQLAEVKSKYAKYVASRKALLSLVAQRPQPSIPPKLQAKTAADGVSAPAAPPVTHILTPYIEDLLSVSRTQKSVISQRSHTKAMLGKQTREAYQTLGHLAEESQLLPAHPMKESLRRRSGLWNELTSTSSDRPDLANRVKPWVFAADSAKIAALESVAETVDGGQLALEDSMKALQDIKRLLGEDKPEDATEDATTDATEDDVWLSTGGNKAASARKHSEREKKRSTEERKDIWSVLQGNLGLIGQEDSA